jgi:uncharacterized protein (TIGR02996 family)
MTALDNLRAAIVDDLDNDEPRLVYADALQAVGDPQGELITIQSELARAGCDRTQWARPAWEHRLGRRNRRHLTGHSFAIEPAHCEALRKRESELLAGHGETWSAGLGRRGGFVDHVIGGVDPDEMCVNRITDAGAIALAAAAASSRLEFVDVTDNSMSVKGRARLKKELSNTRVLAGA